MSASEVLEAIGRLLLYFVLPGAVGGLLGYWNARSKTWKCDTCGLWWRYGDRCKSSGCARDR